MLAVNKGRNNITENLKAKGRNTYDMGVFMSVGHAFVYRKGLWFLVVTPSSWMPREA
jgi:hypothetical protein